MGAYGISIGAKPLCTISLERYVACLSQALWVTRYATSSMPLPSTAHEVNAMMPVRQSGRNIVQHV
jgi:hypothetical protein